MADDEARELQDAIDKIVQCDSKKILVVAGPGAGKTFLFEKILKHTDGAREKRLVITFVNNLKDDLEKKLGELSQVFTLHGYCQFLLHRTIGLRNGLAAGFVCYPGLISMIKKDWE